RENLTRLQERWMKAMIVANAIKRTGLLRRRFEFLDLAHADRTRLFREHVFARGECLPGNRGERGIERGDHHAIDVRRIDRALDGIGRFTTGAERREFLRALEIQVASDGNRARREKLDALLPNQT